MEEFDSDPYDVQLRARIIIEEMDRFFKKEISGKKGIFNKEDSPDIYTLIEKIETLKIGMPNPTSCDVF